MSFKNRFFSGITLGAAVFAFSAIGMAQEATTTTAPADKVVKEKGEHRGHGEFGKRGFGRGQFGGKFGRGGHRGMGMMGGRGIGFLRGIELTEAQKTQLKAIHEANKPSQETMDELRTILAARRDGTITEAQKTRAKAFHDEMKAKHQSIKSQVEAILTPEQKEQIEKRKVEMKQRMEERQKMRLERKAAQPATTTTTDKPKDN